MCISVRVEGSALSVSTRVSHSSSPHPTPASRWLLIYHLMSVRFCAGRAATPGPIPSMFHFRTYVRKGPVLAGFHSPNLPAVHWGKTSPRSATFDLADGFIHIVYLVSLITEKCPHRLSYIILSSYYRSTLYYHGCVTSFLRRCILLTPFFTWQFSCSACIHDNSCVTSLVTG